VCVCLCVCLSAGGIQSAVAAVSPGAFPMLIQQRPGSIPPEQLIVVEQQRRAAAAAVAAAAAAQHINPASLATHVCTRISHTAGLLA